METSNENTAAEEMVELAEMMDIPSQRVADARWILRNAAVRNFDHPKIMPLLRAARAVVGAASAGTRAKCGCRVSMGFIVETCRDGEILECAAGLALDQNEYDKHQRAWKMVTKHRERVRDELLSGGGHGTAG